MSAYTINHNITEDDLYILIDLLKGGKIDLSSLSTEIKKNESMRILLNDLAQLDDNWFLRPSDFLNLFKKIIKNIENNFMKNIEEWETLRQTTDMVDSNFQKGQKENKYYILFMVYLLLLRSLLNTKLGEREMEWRKDDSSETEDKDPNSSYLGEQRITIQKYFKWALKDCYRANHLLSRYIDNINRIDKIKMEVEAKEIKLEKNEVEIIYILRIFLYGNLGNIFYKRYSFQKSYEYYCKAINLTKHISSNPIFTLDKLKSEQSSFKSIFKNMNEGLICSHLQDKILNKSELLNMELYVKKGKTIIELGRFVESIKWFLMAMELFYKKIKRAKLGEARADEIDSLVLKIHKAINYINTIIYNDVVNKVYIFDDMVIMIDKFILFYKTIDEESLKDSKTDGKQDKSAITNLLPYNNIALDAVIRLIYILTMLRKDNEISEGDLNKIGEIFNRLHGLIKNLGEGIISADLTNLKYEYRTLLYTSELYLNYLLFLRPSDDSESKNINSEILLKVFISKKVELDDYLKESNEESLKGNLSAKTTTLITNFEGAFDVVKELQNADEYKNLFKKKEDYESFISELYFIMMLEMDNFAKVKARMKDYLLKESTLSKEAKENILPVITVLKRYNSSNPIIPRPEIEHVRGGGYFIITPTNKKIIIDPGVGFLRNFYNEGFTIQNIDAIMITHAHLDHMADFENIMTLIYEYNENIKNMPNANKKYIDLFLNPGSACKAMSLISAERKYINAIYGLSPDEKFKNNMKLNKDNEGEDYVLRLEKKYGFNLTVLPTKHNDILFKEFSVGLKFDFLFPDSPEQKMIIGFPSDTGYFNGLSGKYQECDMIFCHLGDAYYPELYYPTYKNELINIPFDLTTENKKECLKRIASTIPNQEPLIDDDPESSEQKWDIIKLANNKYALFAGYHLAIRGLYTFIDDILREKKSGDPMTIFAISEFPEELESRRVNIGKTIEKKLKLKHSNISKAFIVINTDIGMRFLYGMPNINCKQEIKVHCDICALQDIDEDKEYHPASDMRFTCVKAEEERIESRCKKHTIVWVDKWVTSTDYINRKLIT